MRGHRPLSQVNDLEDLGLMVDGYKKMIQNRIDSINTELSSTGSGGVPSPKAILNSFIESLGYTRLPTGETVNMVEMIAYMERFKTKAMEQAMFSTGFDNTFQISSELIGNMEKIDPMVLGVNPSVTSNQRMDITYGETMFNPNLWDETEGFFQVLGTDKFGNSTADFYLVKKFDPVERDMRFLAYKIYEMAGVQVPQVKMHNTGDGEYLWLKLPTDSSGKPVKIGKKGGRGSSFRTGDQPSGQRMATELEGLDPIELEDMFLTPDKSPPSGYVGISTAIDLLLGTPYNPVMRPRVMGDLGERLVRLDLGGIFYQGMDELQTNPSKFPYQIGVYDGRVRIGLSWRNRRCCWSCYRWFG